MDVTEAYNKLSNVLTDLSGTPVFSVRISKVSIHFIDQLFIEHTFLHYLSYC